ncbi:MAG: UDP-glucose 4-epimerase [Gammaproteobacteria bacterium]|jgi:UDP-glucose 4-epimerase
MGVEGLKRVCVTGGAGFIGVRLVSNLLERGIEVTVLDDLSVGVRSRVPDGARLVVGDIRDAAPAREAVDGCDALVHLAARVAIRSSFEHAVDDTSINVVGTASMLRAAIDAGTVRRFVFASSMAVYADSLSAKPIDESHLARPTSPYGISKLAAERLVHLMCAEAGLSSTALRLFNTYGPGQTFSPYVGVVTIFVTQLLNGQPVTIFGDGEQCRDFVHVDDVATAFVLAVQSERSQCTYNVGTGHAISVNEVYERVCRAMDKDIAARHVVAAPGELRYSIADINAARHELGYSPERKFDSEIAPAVAEILSNATVSNSGGAR